MTLGSDTQQQERNHPPSFSPSAACGKGACELGPYAPTNQIIANEGAGHQLIDAPRS